MSEDNLVGNLLLQDVVAVRIETPYQQLVTGTYVQNLSVVLKDGSLFELGLFGKTDIAVVQVFRGEGDASV